MCWSFSFEFFFSFRNFTYQSLEERQKDTIIRRRKKNANWKKKEKRSYGGWLTTLINFFLHYTSIHNPLKGRQNKDWRPSTVSPTSFIILDNTLTSIHLILLSSYFYYATNPVSITIQKGIKTTVIKNSIVTSRSRSTTRLFWAPAGAFLILLTCWSLSVSLENLTAGAGVLALVDGDAATGKAFWVTLGLDFATLVSVDRHFACCCLLSLSYCSCSAIYAQEIIRISINYYYYYNFFSCYWDLYWF